MNVVGTRIDPHSRHSYENAPTPLSIAPLNPSIPRSRHSGPQFVIPAKAGIQGRGGRRTRATLSRYGQFRHNLRSLFDHNLQTRRTNHAQI